MGQSLEKGIRKITNILCYIGMGVLMGLMFLGTADVIGRYLLNKPIKGAYGISEAMLVAITFFGWADTLSVEGHVCVDAFISRLRPKARAIIGVITSFIALVVFGLMTWRSALKAIASSKGTEVIDVINIPIYLVQFLVSVGAFVLCLELIIQMVHFVAGLRKRA
jgi:TRAP-type C4-dicarboxylate transport system permease small subunit